MRSLDPGQSKESWAMALKSRSVWRKTYRDFLKFKLQFRNCSQVGYTVVMACSVEYMAHEVCHLMTSADSRSLFTDMCRTSTS